MSVRQFEEWRAYADIEPWDEGRADLRAATIVRELRQLFASNGGKRVWKLDECALSFGGEAAGAREAGPDGNPARDQIVKNLSMLAAICGARRRTVKKGTRRGR